MRNAVALGDVPASQNSDDRRAGELALGAGQRFRHGAVPGQLSLDETLEFGLRYGFRYRCLVGLRRARPLRGGKRIGAGRQCLLEEVNASKLSLIGRTGWSGVRQAFALRDRNTLPPLLAHLRYKLPLDVEGSHWNAVEASELEQWHVESRIVGPNLSPFGCLPERLIVQPALHPT